MATLVKVNGVQYPAVITGKMHDRDWDDRPSKSIQLEMTYEQAVNTFVDDIAWSILQEHERLSIEEREVMNEETGEMEIVTEHVMIPDYEEYDNSEYNLAGDIIDHRNGYITVKMGKMTAEEMLAMIEEVL
jgi:hypothetical protein